MAFQNLYDAINNIPVHIGLSNLKHILYHALLPQFLEWSKGFPLSIEECELRDKNWVKLVPRQPDIDIIADQFFEAKAKSKVKVFSAKKSADLSLCIKNEKYQEILQHIVDLDEGSEDVRTSSFFAHLIALTKFQVLFAPKPRCDTGSSIHNSSGTGIRTLSTRNKGKKRKLSNSEVCKDILPLNRFIYEDSF